MEINLELEKLITRNILSKREFIASMAMNAIWSSGFYDPKTGETKFIPKEITVKKSVEMADALLKALEEKT